MQSCQNGLCVGESTTGMAAMPPATTTTGGTEPIPMEPAADTTSAPSDSSSCSCSLPGGNVGVTGLVLGSLLALLALFGRRQARDD
jgi:hypothetical protein